MSNIAGCSSGTGSMDALIRAGRAAADAWLNSFVEVTKLGLSFNTLDRSTNLLRKTFEGLRPRASCEIPPACWMPKSLGELRSIACIGGSATLRIRVTNCLPRSSAVRVTFGRSDTKASVTPPSATLGPMERAWFTATVPLSADAPRGQQHELLLWVLGCNAHYLRWTVEACDGSSSSCHEVEVEDCTDQRHHWYDHFYCERRCMHLAAGTKDSAGMLLER